MSRVIKFRAWNWRDKKYEYQPLIFNTKGSKFDWQYKASKSRKGMQPVLGDLEQFTGLHDKNGKEIYEGDIIQGSVRASGDYAKYLVEWDKTYGSFICGFLKSVSIGCETHNHPLGELRFDCEVIGNIHETPELLEAQND